MNHRDIVTGPLLLWSVGLEDLWDKGRALGGGYDLKQIEFGRGPKVFKEAENILSIYITILVLCVSKNLLLYKNSIINVLF